MLQWVLSSDSLHSGELPGGEQRGCNGDSLQVPLHHWQLQLETVTTERVTQ